MKKIKWIRPSGTEISISNDQANINQAIKLGWKRAPGPTEEKIKKEMGAAASSAVTLTEDEEQEKLAAFLKG